MAKFAVLYSLLLSVFISSSAHAFLVGTYGKETQLDPNKRTRVIVTGRGKELVSLFQESAAAKAKKYKELYPDDQILFLGVIETPEYGENFKYDNWALLKEYKFNAEEKKIAIDFNPMKGTTYSDQLSVRALIEVLTPYVKIASLDIYSHSTPTYGVILDGKWNRLDDSNRQIKILKKNFTEDAYAFLHGCNSGAGVAQHLSKVWNIPVAGSLTSTTSQRLFEDGAFYADEEYSRPANLKKVKTNKLSYKKNAGCYDGSCVRFKPDNSPYAGYWGKFENGLPFFKFFCVDIETEKCERIMSQSMLSFISVKAIDQKSELEDYKNVVKDFLCPTNKKGDIQQKCMDELDLIGIEQGDETYNPFSGEQIQCDFSGCEVKYDCTEIPIIGITIPESCQLINTSTQKATTLVKEYRSYINGFKSLKKQGFKLNTEAYSQVMNKELFLEQKPVMNNEAVRAKEPNRLQLQNVIPGH